MWCDVCSWNISNGMISNYGVRFIVGTWLDTQEEIDIWGSAAWHWPVLLDSPRDRECGKNTPACWSPLQTGKDTNPGIEPETLLNTCDPVTIARQIPTNLQLQFHTLQCTLPFKTPARNWIRTQSRSRVMIACYICLHLYRPLSFLIPLLPLRQPYYPYVLSKNYYIFFLQWDPYNTYLIVSICRVSCDGTSIY